MHPVGLYRSLADPLRLRLLALLADGPLCVCHLMELVQKPQVTVSKHLRYMRLQRVLRAERRAQWMVYGLAPEAVPLVAANLAALASLPAAAAALGADAERLAALRARRTEGSAPAPLRACACDAADAPTPAFHTAAAFSR